MMLMIMLRIMITLMIMLYQFDEKHGETWAKPHQRGKPNNNTPTSDISVNINDDLQS